MKAEAAAVRDHRPVYIQIAETLRARVLSGLYKDKLDGELKLADEWGVSRRTIQQAVDILVGEGLVGRQQGAGSFINPGGVAKRYRAIASITDSLRGQGRVVSYRILESGLVKPHRDATAFFRLRAGVPAYRHKRLVLADSRPVAVADTLLNAALLEGVELSGLDEGLYDTLRREFGRTIVHAEDSYSPYAADEETARWLTLKPNAAIFRAERRAHDQSGAPIELSTISFAPAPLEISIHQAGADWPGKPPAGPWEYRVGFGDFAD